MKRSVATLSITFAATVAHAVFAQDYQFYPLHDLPGGASFVFLGDLAENGLVVGASVGENGSVPVYWDAATHEARLLAVDPEVGSNGAARAVNDAGIIVGEARVEGGTIAVFWEDVTAPMSVIRWPASADGQERAVALDEAGIVFGSSSSMSEERRPSIFILGPNALETMPLDVIFPWDGGPLASSLVANDAAMISLSFARSHPTGAFLDTTFVSLSTNEVRSLDLSFPQAQISSMPNAINLYGTIVGQTFRVIGELDNYPSTDWLFQSLAFEWQPMDGTLRNLPMIGDDLRSSVARGINDNGAIVGNVQTVQSRFAVLWTPDGRVLNLNAHTSLPDGWQLTDAFHIYENGMIAGLAVDAIGRSQGFLLIPSAPP